MAIRATYSTCLLVLCAILLVGFALAIVLNPEVGFLGPSFASGQWILAPPPVCIIAGDECHGAVFRKEVYIPRGALPASRSTIEVTAASGYELRFNGHVLSDRTKRFTARNWRASDQYDLQDFLQIGAYNTLEIAVWNRTRPPALLVNGRVGVHSIQDSLSLSLSLRTPLGGCRLCRRIDGKVPT